MMLYIFLFLLGSIFGSFICLVVERRIRGESIIYPRSFCQNCKKTLGFMDLFPILSFVFNRGRCRYCGKELSIMYPIIEMICGYLMILSFRISRNISAFVIFSICLYLALIIALIDFKILEYFSYQVYILIGLGLIYRYKFIGFDINFIKFIFIFSLGYFLLYKLSEKSLGDGDYFYYIGLFLLVDNNKLLFLLLFSIWIGALYGIVVAIKYKNTKLKIPFCPHIFLSLILILILWG